MTPSDTERTPRRERSTDSQDVEQRIATAAGKSAAARRELEELIREARSEGLPLRTIAASAQMSYETVRRIAP